jgi:ssRNA-specific RNase YbeY (16S rRNA maturation enzyme)
METARLAFVSDGAIRRLNKQFRESSRTDVLFFSHAEPFEERISRTWAKENLGGSGGRRQNRTASLFE